MDLCRDYRPKKLADVIGQPEAVAKLAAMKDLPPCLLLTGPAGTGKTTLARVMAKQHGCKGLDLHQMNAATERGIDDIRAAKNLMAKGAIYGRRRVCIIDEVHQLQGPAQSALLGPLEEPAGQSRYILCTTDPAKLLKTIRTRCTEVKLKPVPTKALVDHIYKVYTDVEGKAELLTPRVAEKIADTADGSVRMALKLLEQCVPLADEKAMLAAIEVTSGETEGIEVARKLLAWPKPVWSEVSKALKNCTAEPETIRRIVLGYMNTVLLGGGKMAGLAARIIEVFQYPVYDSGKAGLTLMAYTVCSSK